MVEHCKLEIPAVTRELNEPPKNIKLNDNYAVSVVNGAGRVIELPVVIF